MEARLSETSNLRHDASRVGQPGAPASAGPGAPSEKEGAGPGAPSDK